MLSETDVEDHYNPYVRLIEIEKNNAQCGFQLTRGKWDPYPWVSNVDEGTAAANAGLKPGDCVLEVNGEDVVGKRISEIAEIVKSKSGQVSLLLWNAGVDPHCTPEALCCGPLPKNLQRLTACLSAILTFLECPVCLDMIPPPTYQCDNGHLICIRCRTKSERCPVCRIRLNRGRSLISDQIYHAFIDAFQLKEESEETRSSRIQQIFKQRLKKGNIPDIKITQSHTNKLLARIIGKATSVDNLTPNSKFLSPNDTSVFDGTQLKAKSLSTNEIFVSESPVISRHGSVSRLNKKCINTVKVDKLKNRSASCHGSYESFESNINLNVSPIYNSFNCLKANLTKNDTSYHCPFATKCKILLKGSDIFDHFHTIHREIGPLVQYFTSNIEMCIEDLQERYNRCNVIFSEGHLYFLKFLPTHSDNNESLQNILIWMWYLGDRNTAKDYEIQVEIKHYSLDDVLLSVRSPVFSLSNTSVQDIIDGRKGIFLSGKSIEALESSSKKLLVKTQILRTE